MKKWFNPVRRLGQTLAWALVLALATTSWASAATTSTGTSSATSSSAAPSTAAPATTTDPDRGAGDDHDLLDADGDSDETVQGLAVASAVLPQAMVGQPYSYQLTATGAVYGAPLTWSGTAPFGLTLSTSGLISGTPTGTLGPASFDVSVQSTVRLVDGNDSGAEAVTESPSEENKETPPGEGSATAHATLSLTLVPGIDITSPATLPAAHVGVPYAYLISASGGSSGQGGSGFSWTLQSASFVSWTAAGPGTPVTTLPAGLTFSADGVLSGIPTQSGIATIRLQTTNPTVPGYPTTSQTTYTNSKTFTVDILPTTLRMATDVLPDAVVNGGYTQTLQTNGGGTPYPSGCGYTWRIATGSLPDGLGLQCNSGQEQITGTPLQASVATFTVEATDDGSTASAGVPAQQSASVELDILVEPSSALTLGNVTLPAGTVGHSFGPVLLTVTGGTGPYTWTFTGSTSPPAWLNFSRTSTVAGDTTLEGTPTAAFSGDIGITVTDANGQTATGSFSLNIGAAGLSITTSSLPNGAVGCPYPGKPGSCTGNGVQFAATGGTGPYTWAVSSAAATACANATGSQSTQLPCGLSLSSSGLLSGTPLSGSGGAYDISVQVTDSSNTPLQASITLPLTITTAALTITLPNGSTTLPEAEETVQYTQVMQATGGNGSSTYNWQLGQHSLLPSGLQLAPFTCTSCGKSVISGTPVVGDSTGGPTGIPSDGLYSFTIKVTDNANNQATQTFSLKVLPVVKITTTTVPNAEVSAAYSATLTTYSATLGEYTGSGSNVWSVSSGSLPAGLTLSGIGSGTTAKISGQPTGSLTAPQTFTFTIQVKDRLGGTATETYTMTVIPGVKITTPTVPNAEVNTTYSATLDTTGGSGSNVWLSGSLPAGLTLSGSGATATISGTPTTPASSGQTFTIQVKDVLGGTATETYTMRVYPAISGIAVSPTSGTPGSTYTGTLTASGGTGTYTWSIPSAGGNALPSWLHLSGDTLSGTMPSTHPATYTFNVTATDTLSGTATQSVTITTG